MRFHLRVSTILCLLLATSEQCVAYEMLVDYVSSVSDYAEPFDRVLIVLIECTRRDYTMMQLTQYESIDHASVAVHQCDGAPIDVTYERLFAQLVRLPEGQLVAIFEDDLFLMPYSAQWFDFCAVQFKNGAHDRLFSCSFWNDDCFGQKKPVALARYVRSHSFGGLGFMMRVDDRLRQFAAHFAETSRRVGGKRKPWDLRMSDWFIENDLMTLAPEMSRVRHVPHSGAKHLGLLKQAFMSTTENVVSVARIYDAVEECNVTAAHRIETLDEYIEYFKRVRSTSQQMPMVIGDYPRQYFDGVHVHFDGSDSVHCALIDKSVFDNAHNRNRRPLQPVTSEEEEAVDVAKRKVERIYTRRHRRHSSRHNNEH